MAIQQDPLQLIGSRWLLISVVSMLVFLLGLSPTNLIAGTSHAAVQRVQADTAAAREELLNRLHAALSNASTEQEARGLSQQIWAVWLSHPDPTIHQLMQDALEARQSTRLDFAISLLDTIIEREPDYAEAWNQRATIYYMMGEYEKSLEDVAETLKREPRHFGALSGRGMIRLRQGRDALAWQNFEAARKIHPFIGGRHLVPKSVRETDT